MSSLNSSLNLVVDELLVTIAPFFLITAAAVVVGELNFVLNIGPWEWDPSRGFLGIWHLAIFMTGIVLVLMTRTLGSNSVLIVIEPFMAKK